MPRAEEGPATTTLAVPRECTMSYDWVMELAYVGGAATTAAPAAATAAARQTSRAKKPAPGVNVRPGSADDGWIAPKPVTLSDGTEVQLFKDGEGLAAAYQ